MQVPGPGEYHPGREGRAPATTAAASSSFATKVLRLTQTRPEIGRTPPGPGDYVSTFRNAIKAPRGVPKQHQFFNSTQRRSSDIDPLKLRSAPSFWKDPGPGAYNAPSAFSRPLMSDPACSAFNSTQVPYSPAPRTLSSRATQSWAPLCTAGQAQLDKDVPSNLCTGDGRTLH